MSEPPSKVRRSLQSTIQSFFPAHGAPPSSSSVPNLTAPATPEQVHLPNVDFDEDANPGQLPLPATANDIGHAVGRPLTAEDRAIFITPWIPTADSDYPTSTHIKSGVQRIRRLLPHHLTDFPWLVVSRVHNKTGAFCVPCVLFAARSGVGGRALGHGQMPGTLVTKPLVRMDDLTGKNGALSCHQEKEYHKRSVLDMQHFDSVFVHGDSNVHTRLDQARAKEVEQNRNRLHPMVDTILTCARKNIALRGHRFESEPLAADGEEQDMNDGNFRALLRYRIRGGDSALSAHVMTAKGNATYLSASIQNAIISAAGDLVKESVIARIKRARCWVLIADETTDRHKREQLAVVVRYVVPNDVGLWHCYEDTVAILDIVADIRSRVEDDEVRLSGAAIGETLLKTVAALGLDMTSCVGQGYDGASTMAGARGGAAANVLKQAPHAYYFHCAMHCLNLSAPKAVTVPAIQHAQVIVRDVSACFRSSAKRTELLKTCIQKSNDTRISKKVLTTLCETRFIERHTTVVTLRQLLRFVVEALELMKTWRTEDARKTANNLENAICKSDFVVSLLVLEKVSGLMLPITRMLQAVQLDLVQAMTHVSDRLNALKDMKPESAFSKLFAEAALLADLLGIVLSKPRTASRSVYRAAAGADGAGCTTEEYYRVNYYFATLDAVITDIELRFGARQTQAMNISRLIPRLMSFGVGDSERQWEQLQEATSQYEALLEDPAVIVKSEFDLWRRKWERVAEDKWPSTALSALDHCGTDGYYRNIAMLLQILHTLPVTTAEAERLFSKLERTLTAIRSTIEEKRLEALLMLQVHKDLTPSITAVIDRFATTSARRLKFVL